MPLDPPFRDKVLSLRHSLASIYAGDRSQRTERPETTLSTTCRSILGQLLSFRRSGKTPDVSREFCRPSVSWDR